MPRTSPLPQSRSRSSLLSNTTYHSFHDVEPQPAMTTSATVTQPDHAKQMYDADNISISSEMHRQDSGYESISPRDPQPSRGPRFARQETASATSSRPASRVRPSTRRSSKSGPVTRAPKTKLGSRSLLLTQSNPVSVRPSSYYGYPESAGTSPYNPQANTQSSYFHFPPPDPQTHDIMLQTTDGHQHMPSFNDPYADSAPVPGLSPSSPSSPSSPYDAPPQTTHYWTSDHTRRLEYAAIDAASRGFKGWLMRHMVPDCFVPKAKRRVTFDDDTGSVRRYRLELDENDELAGKVSHSGELISRPQKKRASTFWV
ncbi:hypothetical protein F503_01296 [Ophiostoma piceae UAMH 11346]|uniref:Uncharacterized protein n=1 Tax=Ophiostoma piceae (strain UAMH 11346) TaxID=1262450 RepID=S3BUY1_OPHP1|nr:hypothetical protein F503_01296 [Ophiostoma piceae UAMH 11346]